MAKLVFDAGSYLNQQGLTFLGNGSDENHYRFSTGQDEEIELNVNDYLKSKGVPIDKMTVELNAPESAVEDSPISIPERARLALGNTRGQVNYLKGKYDDAAYTPDNGLVVKDKGIWKKVDKSSMDGWELTADIVEGAIGLAPSLLGGGAGAAIGATLGPAGSVAGVVGSITGSGVGAGIAEAIRGTLGRAAGTYDATPEEELKNIGWEVLLNSGGQALALGAKPVLGKIIAAAKNVSKTAPEATKSVLAETLGRTTGAGAEATSVLFEAPEQVGKQITRAVSKYGSEGAAVEGLKQQNIRAVGRLIDQTPKALTRQFGALVDDLAQSAPKNFEVNIGSIIKEAEKELAEKGLGIQQDGIFRTLTNKEALTKIIAGQEGNLLDDTTRSAIDKMTSIMNELSQGGTAKGATGVKALMEVKRNLNQIARNIADGNQAPTLKKFVGDIRDSVLNQISNKFTSAGIGEKYLATSSLYEKFAASAHLARKLQRQVNGDELLLNKLMSGVGRNQQYKDLAQDMALLTGNKGQAIMQGIRLRDAASKFTSTLPRVTLGSLAGGNIAGIATATGFISPLTFVAGATQASPRFVAGEVQAAAKLLPYTKKMADFVRNLTPQMRMQWLRDPRLVESTIRATVDAYGSEDASKNELLQMAGGGQ